MSKNKNIRLLDLLVLAVKWKKFLILLFFSVLVISYLAIYFFVEKRYEASSLLLPSQDDNTAGLLSGLKGLPIDIGGLGPTSDVDLYKSIIFSRSVLDQVINHFDLIKVYEIDTTKPEYYEELLKKLRGNISADLNDDGLTYIVSATAKTPRLAAEMTNFIVQKLNDKIIQLKTRKSMENRIFLEARVNDIKDSLRIAEDQMKEFQQKTNMFAAEDQTKAILETLAKLQANLAVKQTEYSITKEIYGENSPQATNAKIVAKEYENKLSTLESGNGNKINLLSLNNLPQKAISYLRLYRNVEIYTNILEFELPLYEQAKIQEQKTVPILQVIDIAIPPVKRSYPQRVLMASIITLGIMLLAFIFIYFRDNDEFMNNTKVIFIRENLFRWKT